MGTIRIETEVVLDIGAQIQEKAIATKSVGSSLSNAASQASNYDGGDFKTVVQNYCNQANASANKYSYEMTSMSSDVDRRVNEFINVDTQSIKPFSSGTEDFNFPATKSLSQSEIYEMRVRQEKLDELRDGIDKSKEIVHAVGTARLVFAAAPAIDAAVEFVSFTNDHMAVYNFTDQFSKYLPGIEEIAKTLKIVGLVAKLGLSWLSNFAEYNPITAGIYAFMAACFVDTLMVLVLELLVKKGIKTAIKSAITLAVGLLIPGLGLFAGRLIGEAVGQLVGGLVASVATTWMGDQFHTSDQRASIIDKVADGMEWADSKFADGKIGEAGMTAAEMIDNAMVGNIETSNSTNVGPAGVGVVSTA